MKPQRTPTLALVLGTLTVAGCLSPRRPPLLTPPEVAELGCYELTLDWHLGPPTVPEYFRIRLDSLPRMLPRLAGHHTYGLLDLAPGFWQLRSADTLWLRFGGTFRWQGIEVRLGGPADSLEGWAFEREYTGVGSTPWFSRAHAARIACAED